MYSVLMLSLTSTFQFSALKLEKETTVVKLLKVNISI